MISAVIFRVTLRGPDTVDRPRSGGFPLRGPVVRGAPVHRIVSVTATAIPGGIDLRASYWDLLASPYPRPLAYRRVGSSQSWSGDGDKLRALAAVLLDLADSLYPLETEQGAPSGTP